MEAHSMPDLDSTPYSRLVFLFAAVGHSLLCSAALPAEAADSDAVVIDAEFPGGNVAVTKNEDGTVHVAPDLRGDNPWFYWYFEAKASRPGRVDFVFPEKVVGFKNGAIGNQGPAISKDLGETWRWMGTEQVDGSSFFYDFKAENERVRFAVTIPYVQKELDGFLKRNDGNAHLKKSVLAKSLKGREVELLQIGNPGPNINPVLVTGRHHATETIASYVLEGFMQEAMSASPSGQEFRSRYVLFAVPFVDKDGVEQGDQGKNRKPHDHNRDYGEDSIYPEVKAIKQLDQLHDFQFALDFHCPTLVMPDHQVMYFVGGKTQPKYNFDNVSEFAGWMKKGLPKTAPHGPLVWLRDKAAPAPMNSTYFGSKANSIMAATIEIPFAPANKATDPQSCRGYGKIMLEAWVNTHFLSGDVAR
ncbi:MAG: hypothetical protein ACI93T_001567 [Porticoccaceae bacterium]|jgi:hypothetical protein